MSKDLSQDEQSPGHEEYRDSGGSIRPIPPSTGTSAISVDKGVPEVDSSDATLDYLSTLH